MNDWLIFISVISAWPLVIWFDDVITPMWCDWLWLFLCGWLILIDWLCLWLTPLVGDLRHWYELNDDWNECLIVDWCIVISCWWFVVVLISLLFHWLTICLMMLIWWLMMLCWLIDRLSMIVVYEWMIVDFIYSWLVVLTVNPMMLADWLMMLWFIYVHWYSLPVWLCDLVDLIVVVVGGGVHW